MGTLQPFYQNKLRDDIPQTYSMVNPLLSPLIPINPPSFSEEES